MYCSESSIETESIGCVDGDTDDMDGDDRDRDMRRNLLGELADMIMKAEKPHSGPSVNWRPRDACIMAQLESINLRTREGDSVMLSLRLKT